MTAIKTNPIPSEGELIERLRRYADSAKSQGIGAPSFHEDITQAADALQALIGEVIELRELAYAPDGREHRSLYFAAVADNMRLSDHCTATDTGAHGWLSIESAPKDGTRILLYGPYRYTAPDPDRSYAWSAFTAPPVVGEGYFYAGLWQFRNGVGEPTHWQPLPPLPQNVARSDQTTASDKSRALSPLPNVPVDGRLRGAQVQSDRLEIATGGDEAVASGPTRASGEQS